MGMSMDIQGYRAKDTKWKKMEEAYKACRSAGIGIPKEIDEFFVGEDPNYISAMVDGLTVDLGDAVTEIDEEMVEGYWVDITKLPKDIKILRFTNSY